MSKRIVRTVQKEETINVCDICNKELPFGSLEIDIDWAVACPDDRCYDDCGSFNYCSFKCFSAGVVELTKDLKQNEDFLYQSFTISSRSVGQSPDILPNILSLLAPQKKKGSE